MEIGVNFDRTRFVEESVKELTFTLTLSAIPTSIIAIFLPVAFMKGILGKFFFEFGVTISVAVALSINATIGGERVGKYTKDGRRYDVRVRLIPSQRSRAQDIEKLWVWNNRGELVQLKEVVAITQKSSYVSITRKGRERAISLFANIAPGKSQQTALEEAERLAKETLPEGYNAVFGGSTQSFRESFQSILFALWLGIIVAYMVLGSQYNSYLHPITVLLALPFSVSGALVALLRENQGAVFSVLSPTTLQGHKL